MYRIVSYRNEEARLPVAATAMNLDLSSQSSMQSTRHVQVIRCKQL